jgi:hypothetical protein
MQGSLRLLPYANTCDGRNIARSNEEGLVATPTANLESLWRWIHVASARCLQQQPAAPHGARALNSWHSSKPARLYLTKGRLSALKDRPGERLQGAWFGRFLLLPPVERRYSRSPRLLIRPKVTSATVRESHFSYVPKAPIDVGYYVKLDLGGHPEGVGVCFAGAGIAECTGVASVGEMKEAIDWSILGCAVPPKC